MKRRLFENKLLDIWKLIDVRHALWSCIALFLSSWIAFGLGVTVARFDLRLTLFFLILGGFLLGMSEVLYWKYRSRSKTERVHA